MCFLYKKHTDFCLGAIERGLLLLLMGEISHSLLSD